MCKLVWDYDVGEEGARLRRQTVVRVERSTRGFCKCVSRDRKTSTQTPEDVSEGTSEDRGGTEEAMGEVQSEAERLNV
jgi:hypothetical protein